MAELWFYHLERSELEKALPLMLEKCRQHGWRALVRGGNQERLALLDAALWTYKDESFLPHGCDGGADPARLPILLTTRADNPNSAQALYLIDGAELGDLAGFQRASIVFDGRDPAALETARSRWKQAKAAGITASYWRESAAGKWEKQI